MVKKIFCLVITVLLLVFPQLTRGEEVMMKLTSPDFDHEGDIPSLFTCQGQDISPALLIEDVPQDAKSLALIVDDPDAPMGMWVHWVVYNIDPATMQIQQGGVPGIEGDNDFGQVAYGGPCPPSGRHRYYFKLYALDTVLDANASLDKMALESAMEGHILAQATLMGYYRKK